MKLYEEYASLNAYEKDEHIGRRESKDPKVRIKYSKALPDYRERGSPTENEDSLHRLMLHTGKVPSFVIAGSKRTPFRLDGYILSRFFTLV